MSLNLPSLAELRNTEVEIARFHNRVVVLQIVVLACFVLLASRLVYLQIVRHEDLLAQAENNRTAVLPTVPPRGTILDRNGVVLANNYSAYTLEITPSKVADVEEVITSWPSWWTFSPRTADVSNGCVKNHAASIHCRSATA